MTIAPALYWVLCTGCDEPFMQRRAGQTTHGNRCTRAANRRAAKASISESNPLVLRRFQHARGIARHRGVEWALAIDEYARMVAQPCAYCGGPLSGTGIGLDQLVPGEGYTQANVVPCCWTCNEVKGNTFSADEMRLLGPVLRSIYASWPESRFRRHKTPM